MYFVMAEEFQDLEMLILHMTFQDLHVLGTIPQ
jgi:hypothetical protein